MIDVLLCNLTCWKKIRQFAAPTQSWLMMMVVVMVAYKIRPIWGALHICGNNVYFQYINSERPGKVIGDLVSLKFVCF